jgi:DNA mismatch repair protein MutS
MGARLLRQWLLRPSIDINEINRRLEAVDEARRSSQYRDNLRRTLEPMGDIERLAGKLTLNRATARDLLALARSFQLIPDLKSKLAGSRAEILAGIGEGLDELNDVRELISAAISDEAPQAANESGMIRTGYNSELDELRHLAHSGKSYIASIEARERGRTGISSLKVKFNNVFGYFIEVSNTHKSRVPDDYVRKQTLVSAERYTMAELKEYEAKVLGAEERILELEINIFDEVRRWTQDTKLPDGRRVADQEWVQLNLARVHAKLEFVKLINWKVAAAGGANPADASATKVFATEFYTEAYRHLMEILGPNG